MWFSALFSIAVCLAFAKGNTTERKSFFASKQDGYVNQCESILITVDSHSPIHCCALCKNQASCYHAHYNREIQVCTGCSMSSGQTFVKDAKSIFIRHDINDSGIVHSPSSSSTTGSTLSNNVSSTISEMSSTTSAVHSTTGTVSKTTSFVPNTTSVMTRTTSTPSSTTSTISTSTPSSTPSTSKQPTTTDMMTSTEKRQMTEPTQNLQTGPTQNPQTEPMVWNGSEYICIRPMSFESASILCKKSSHAEFRGHLVWIENPEENRVVHAFASNNAPALLIYIGFTLVGGEIFSYPNGPAADFSNLYQGFVEGDGQCLAMESLKGMWVKTYCNETLPAVCEMDASGEP